MLCIRELPHLEYHVTRFQRPRIKKGRVREIIRNLRITFVPSSCSHSTILQEAAQNVSLF